MSTASIKEIEEMDIAAICDLCGVSLPRGETFVAWSLKTLCDLQRLALQKRTLDTAVSIQQFAWWAEAHLSYYDRRKAKGN